MVSKSGYKINSSTTDTYALEVFFEANMDEKIDKEKNDFKPRVKITLTRQLGRDSEP